MKLDIGETGLWIEVPDRFPAGKYGRLPGAVQKLFAKEEGAAEDAPPVIDVGEASNSVFKAVVLAWNITRDNLALDDNEKAGQPEGVLPVTDLVLDNMDAFVKTSLLSALVTHITSKMQRVGDNVPKSPSQQLP